MDISELIHLGNLTEALETIQKNVRNKPADAKQRVLLFQLQVILGLWDKARTQLDVLKDLDNMAQFMVQTYHQVLLCEGIRQEVFSGKKAPMIFGEPESWIALILEALRVENDGQFDSAKALRAEALDKATVVSGKIINVQYTMGL